MTRGLLVWLILCGTVAAEVPATLPNTQPLTWDDDLADRMMDGLHRFVERKIEHAVANRQQFWKRDTSSPEAYEKSIAPNRERLKKLIGLVDQRVPVRMEFVSPNDKPQSPRGSITTKGARPEATYTVSRVRWTAFLAKACCSGQRFRLWVPSSRFRMRIQSRRKSFAIRPT